MRTLLAALALALTAPLTPAASAATTLPASQQSAQQSAQQAAQRSAQRRALPSFKVRRPVRGLSHVWDVKSIGAGRWLLTERDTARLHLLRNGRLLRVRFPSNKVWVSGETGLMSLAIDPRFARNRRFYTCQGGRTASGHEVRVMAWRLSTNGRTALHRGKLLGGLPSSSGRHGGCRLFIDRTSGALYVGTGDAAIGRNPRNRKSLGGKVLRLNRLTGKPWPSNPWIGAANGKKRYVFTFGHRNVQGLALRRDGTLWSAEHGPDRDDEVNRLVAGGDYGWNPVPGYNESVPMTDQSLPGDQIAARWSSGFPTVATSGAVWVYGAKWGNLDGTLAVAALKASRILFLRFDADGSFVRARAPLPLRQHGRLRSLTLTPNGDLLATTDNGSHDGVLRITPST
jgi:glucose/arabinose dehydrogenase